VLPATSGEDGGDIFGEHEIGLLVLTGLAFNAGRDARGQRLSVDAQPLGPARRRPPVSEAMICHTPAMGPKRR
jgi:hypothetical protein